MLKRDLVVTHPLDPEDASAIIPMKAAGRTQKGVPWRIDARKFFDTLMEGVSPRPDVTFESATVGDVPGLWVHPASSRSDEAILHVHGGWFNAGSATAYRHLVGHIAARAGARAFVPDYRLAPEHPFPAAVDDVLATYRGMDESGIHRIAITGDSAGGNLALVLASYVATKAVPAKAIVVGAAALSPVTDLTLSGATYETRADADPYFTKQQIAELVHSYLGSADANDPLASPLQGRFSGLPPIRIHVGDDEVLLDDSRRYVERAKADGVDARLDVWTGMPHGFVASIGTLKASAQALDAIGLFLTERLQASNHFGGRTQIMPTFTKVGLDALLTPENCVVLLIDHQPSQLANVNSHDPTLVINNVTALAKTAKAFGVPTILTTINAKRGGEIFKQIQAVFPDQKPIDRTFINSWEDRRVVEAVKNTARKKLVIAALWSEMCLVQPAIHAMGDGYDVYAVTDASGGVSAEAHDMAIRRLVAAGAQPVTWLGMAGELQRDWARTERLGAVAQILFDHAGASGTVLAWELANEAQRA